MRPLRAVLGAVVLAAVLGATPGCKRDAFVLETIAAADGLAVAMIGAVDGGATLSAGILAARSLLEARRTALQDSVVELKSLRGYQMSDPLQARWRDAFIDDVAALEAMQARLRPQTAVDPAAAKALETLVADYVAIVSTTPPGSS